MDASFFSKPLSQLECRVNKKSCHLLEKKGTHPMRMHDNNTTCHRSNQNAGFLDTTNTTCNRSNQNARLPDTHSHSTNQHPAAPDTTKTTCYRSMAQCWKALLVTGVCLSTGGGTHGWSWGGMCGCSQVGGMHGCSWGGVCGCSGGACMVALGGVHGCSRGVWLLLGACMVKGGVHGEGWGCVCGEGGHVWRGGACMAKGGMCGEGGGVRGMHGR